MKPIRAEMMGGRVRTAERIETQTGRQRMSVPPSRSPVIPGIESEADWLDHRADVVRGLAPANDEHEALAEDIARVLWQQRRALRLTEHLRKVVARDRSNGAAFDSARQVNVIRLEKLEALCAELDRRLVAASERCHAAQTPRGRDLAPAEAPQPTASQGTIRKASRPRRNHPYQRPR